MNTPKAKETPTQRTDAFAKDQHPDWRGYYPLLNFARTLERELAEAKADNVIMRETYSRVHKYNGDLEEQNAALKARVERLEGALTEIASMWKPYHAEALVQWSDAGTEAFQDINWCSATAIKRPVELAKAALARATSSKISGGESIDSINPYEWEIANKTSNGGFTKESLASIGVEWPPKKGWMKDWKARFDALPLPPESSEGLG